MSNPQHEPTMEEILASIRKIISEDGPENAPAAEAAPPPPAPAPQPAAPMPQPVHDDVLELTQEEQLTPPAPPPPMPAAVPPAEDLVFQSVEPTPAPQPAPAPEAHSDIFSDHTRRAMEDTFAGIPDAVEEPAPQPARNSLPLGPVDGSSVESVFERAVRESFEPVLQKYLSDNSAAVIDRMKPLIREWMDEHFPPLLEGAVRAEVERVVKARGTKR
jgi:cell pole-organizing protein PopZ